MPTFDIVSQLNLQEIDNAVNQSCKEIATRYDFKNSKSEIRLEKDKIQLVADDDYKMKAVLDILQGKMVKRSVSPKALEIGKVEPALGGLVKCEIKLIQGVSTEKAKEIVKLIKDSKLKVSAQIQEEQVRVSGKNRDDLQQVIAMVRAHDFGLPLQFINFRD
jgi:uncharacterized protein YajQ (UPF0234 family)